jgi:hypothetical protein
MVKTEAICDRAIPLDPTLRALGVVSLLNDFSSEVAIRAPISSPTFWAWGQIQQHAHLRHCSALYRFCKNESGLARASPIPLE